MVLEVKKEDHLMGWGHMLNVRTKEVEEEGAEVEEGEGWDGMGYVGKGVRRRTFYCMTCRSEFPLHEQEEHAAGLVCQVADEWVGDDRSGKEEETDEDGVGVEEDEGGEGGNTSEFDFKEKEDYTEVEKENEKQKQGKDAGAPPLQTPTPHPNASEATFTPETTFTCPTCSYRSFPLSERSIHGRRTWTCDTCGLTMHRSQKAEHKKLPGHTWHCGLCDKTVSRIGRESHEKSEKHQMRMGVRVPEALTATRVTAGEEIPEGAFLCYACESYIPVAEEPQHRSLAWCCDICGKFTHHDWKDTHMMQQHGVELPPSAQAPSGASTNFAVCGANASAGTMFHCLPCKITIPLVGKPKHLASSTHCSNLPPPKFLASKPSVPVQTATPKNPTPLLSPTSSTKPESVYKCVECHISMSIDNMTSHLGDKKHQEALRLAGRADSPHYCAFCKAPVVGGIEAHLASERHRAAMQSAVPGFPAPNPAPAVTRKPPPPPPPIGPQEIFHCDICNRNFFVAQRDLHLGGIIHATAAAAAKREAEKAGKREEVGIPPPATVSLPKVPESDKFYCKVCGVFKGVEGRADHVKSKKHKKKAVKLRKTQAAQEAKGPVKKRGKVSTPTLVKINPPQAPEGSKFYCEVCGVFRCVVGRADHVKSKKHKKKATELAQKRAAQGAKKLVGKKEKVNIPVPVTASPPKALESDKFYCEVCGVFKCVGGKEGHVKSKKHKKKAVELEKMQAAQEAKGLADKREEMSIPVPVTVNPPQAPESNQFYCEVCDVFKCVGGRAGHMGSKKHKKKFVEWERVNVGKAKVQVEVQGGGIAGGN